MTIVESFISLSDQGKSSFNGKSGSQSKMNLEFVQNVTPYATDTNNHVALSDGQKHNPFGGSGCTIL